MTNDKRLFYMFLLLSIHTLFIVKKSRFERRDEHGVIAECIINYEEEMMWSKILQK